MKHLFTLSLALGIFCNSSNAQNTPFTCSNFAYQVVSTGAGIPSVLYQYNINNGQRTTIATITGRVVNSIGYNLVDNMIWGYDLQNSEVVRIDANGIATAFTIPNLPPAGNYIAGDVTPNGYLLLVDQASSIYYVVDVNASRASTYLRIVDPTLGYIIDNSPYGNALSNTTQIADYTYNAALGLFLGVASTGRIARLNINTNTLTFDATPVVNLPTGVNYGATYSDANSDNLYTFNNSTGVFYQISLAGNTAIQTSTSISSSSNDGASCATAVLPVRLSHFSGSIQQGINELRWETAKEQLSSHFEILRSTDGHAFQNIGNVAAAGNSSELKSYRFSDRQPNSGTNFYKLMSVDLDGTTTYSQVVMLNRSSDEAVKIFPVPVQDELHITGLNWESIKELRVMNITNNVVFKTTQKVETIDFSKFASGFYFIQIIKSNAVTEVYKVVK
ncbi:MAG: T9SS type A sorting domain-containing protein [Taibaiella sp.]|nr:T9SS type A sorting domain-containing protein [Taibaiella sp.]